MYEFYENNISSKEFKRARQSLQSIYGDVPETTGCMDNIHAGAKCGAWCCLTPETLVYTAFGPLSIKEITVGMAVMTKGGYKRVVKTASKFVNEEIVYLTTCYGRKISLTSDHKVYAELVRRRSTHIPAEPEFIEAGNLLAKQSNDWGHYIVFPKADWKHDAGGQRYFELLDYLPFCHFAAEFDRDSPPLKMDCLVYNSKLKKGQGIPNQIHLDKAFARMLGLFLAEGSFDDSQLNFHFDSEEFHLHEDVRKFAKVFGLKCSWHTTHGRSFTMRVFSRVMNKLFTELCGDGCENKCLHPRLFDLITTSKELTQSFHDGLYAGDGGRNSFNKGIYSYTTTSPHLAAQVVQINHLLGRLVGVSKYTPNMRKTVWTISDDQSGSYKDYIETEKDWRVPIRSIEKKAYSGLVYDIEVEDEHSFLTEAGEVHNCQHQQPSLYYVEFLNTWNTVINSWPNDKVADLLSACMRQYFDDAPTKGCVFWDGNKKICTQHNTRPITCRIYGQEPDEDFKPKYERLKILYQNDERAVVKEQCTLVKSAGTPPTKKQIEQWDKEIKLLETDLGIDPRLMHDGDGGSYRTYKDHILLKILSPTVLFQMNELKESNNKQEQERFVQAFISEL